MPAPSKPDPDKKNRSKKDAYIQYTNIAFMMFAIIALGTFLGLKLDEWLDLKTHVFTLVFSLLSVFLAIYIVIKKFS